MSILYANDKKVAIMQLSHLISCDIGMVGDECVIMDVILATNFAVTKENLQDLIQEIFHIDMENSRVSNAIKRLIEQNKISEYGNILSLSTETECQIRNVMQINQEIESIAINEWTKEFEEKYNAKLSEIEKGLISKKIELYIKTVFIMHGATSYELLDAKCITEDFDIKKIASLIADDLPESLKYNTRDFFPKVFGENISKKQHQYLHSQINKAIQYISMVESPDVICSISEKVKGLVVYLDTSIVYRLLNLQGEQRYFF